MTTALNMGLMHLSRRAEANDPTTLVQTFVDVGSLQSVLTSRDHQVVFGRRGTGKTHALTYLAETLRGGSDEAVFVDMRYLGSTGGLYADNSLPIAERGTRLLLDTFERIYDRLVDIALFGAYEGELAGEALPILDQLADQISQVRVVGSVELETTSSIEHRNEQETSAQVGLRNPTLGIADTASATVGLNRQVREVGVQRHRVHFGAVGSLLSRALDALDIRRLWVLMDEWSTLPLDLQPLLADLIRRSLMPLHNVTVKIAAIEERSSFKVVTDGDYLGLELGADVSADLDLDDFMVFGNDEERARTFFAALFFKHILTILAAEGLETPRPITTADEFVKEAFTQINAFTELVRAAEGVPRDAINIANLAAQRADRNLISVPHIRTAAKAWYNRDKVSAATANDEARALLYWIIDEVIGQRRAKAFMLEQGPDTQHRLIRGLYDDRVLHVVRKGVAAKDRPGVRFNVYAIDYGAYVDLITTAKEPKGLLPLEDEEGHFVHVDVPAEDYRSIRRAILDLREFETYRSQTSLW